MTNGPFKMKGSAFYGRGNQSVSPAKDLKAGMEDTDGLPHNTQTEAKTKILEEDHEERRPHGKSPAAFKNSPAKSEGHGAPEGHKHKKDIDAAKRSRSMKDWGITESEGTYYSAGGDVISSKEVERILKS